MPIDRELLKKTKLDLKPESWKHAGSRTGPIMQMDYGIGLTDALKYTGNNVNINRDNLNKIKAEGQSEWKKGFNAVVGGISSGILTAVEDIGYTLDIENNIKNLTDIENVESNWLSDLAKQGKRQLDKAMPIYTEDPSAVWDWGDSGHYWKALKGVLDSAVGFAIPGMAATKAVGAVQKLARLNKYMNFFKTSKAGQQLTNSLASGYITNYGEGKMMALELYEDSLEQFKHDLWEQAYQEVKNSGISADPTTLQNKAMELYNSRLDEKMIDFEKAAGDRADKFMLYNKAFMLTDAIGLHGLYRGKGFTRNIMQDPSLKGGLKAFTKVNADNPALQGFKEMGEEIGQNVLQMEGKHQIQTQTGFDNDNPEDLWKRALEFATSDQALLEGAMGLFGGAPQRILTKTLTGGYSKSVRDAEQKAYEDQQFMMSPDAQQRTTTREITNPVTGEIETIEEDEFNNQWFIENRLSEYSQLQKLRAEAMERGVQDLDELLKKQSFLKIVSENFDRGTTEHLERTLKDVANTNLTEEQRLEKGWDENYKEQALEMLSDLKSIEKQWNRLTKYENRSEVFNTSKTIELLEDQLDRVNSNLDNSKSELNKIIQRKGWAVYFDDVTDNQRNELMLTMPGQDYAYYEQAKKQLEEHLNSLGDKLKKITSPDYQRSLVKNRNMIQKRIKELQKQRTAEKNREQQKAKKEARKTKAEQKKAAAEEVKNTNPKENDKADPVLAGDPVITENDAKEGDLEGLFPKAKTGDSKNEQTPSDNPPAANPVTKPDTSKNVEVKPENTDVSEKLIGRKITAIAPLNKGSISGTVVKAEPNPTKEGQYSLTLDNGERVAYNIKNEDNFVWVRTLDNKTDDSKDQDPKGASQIIKEIEDQRTEELNDADENPELIFTPVYNMNIAEKHITKLIFIGSLAGKEQFRARFDRDGNIIVDGNKTSTDLLEKFIKHILSGESNSTQLFELVKTFKHETAIDLTAQLGIEKDSEEKENEIHNKYDALYLDAVNNGELTREQALEALAKAGRKGSEAYKELENYDPGYTPDEQRRDNQLEEKAGSGTFSKSDEKQVDEQNEKTNEDLTEGDDPLKPDDPTVEYDPDKPVSIADKIAFLTVDYQGEAKQSTGKITEGLHDILFNDMVNVGDDIELVVTDEDDIPVYTENPVLSSYTDRSTWGEIKKQESDPIRRIPIRIQKKDGTVIGWMHDMNYADKFTTSAEAQNLYNMRKAVYNAGKVSTKITYKGKGKLNFGQEKTVAEALTDAKLAVYKNKMLTRKGNPVTVKNHTLTEGRTYMILDIGDGKFALEVKPRKMTDSPLTTKISNTITSVLAAYLAGDARNEKQQELVKQIMQATANWPTGSLDITSLADMETYISTFVTNTNTGQYPVLYDRKGSKGYLNQNNIKDNRVLLAIQKGYIEISKNKGTAHVFLHKSLSADQKSKYLEKLSRLLADMYVKIDANLIGHNRTVALVGEDGKIEQVNYDSLALRLATTKLNELSVSTSKGERKTLTVQPVVRFDTSFAQNQQSPTNNKPSDTDRMREALGKSKQQFFGRIDQFLIQLDKYFDFDEKLNSFFEQWIAQNMNKHAEAYNKTISGVTSKESEGVRELNKMYKELTDSLVELLANKKQEAPAQAKPLETNPIEPKSLTPEEKIAALGEGFTKTKKGLSINFAPQMTDSLMTEQQTEEFKKATEAIVISKLGATLQTDLIGTISSNLFKELIDNANKKDKDGKAWKLNFKKEMDEYLDDMLSMKKQVTDRLEKAKSIENGEEIFAEEIERFENYIEKIDAIIDHWGQLSQMVFERLMQYGDIEIDGDPENLNWDDNSAFTADPRDSVAPKMKRFLALIPEKDENGEVVIGSFGQPRYLPFDKVYNLLQRITPNRRPDFNELISALDKHKEAHPMLATVKSRLLEADDQIKNLFVNAMSNHYVRMKYVEWSSINGKMSLKVMDSNANDVAITLQTLWRENLMSHEDVHEVPGSAGTKHFIGEDLIKTMVGIAEQWETTPPTASELQDWLGMIGITVDIRTARDIVDGKFVYLRTLDSFNAHLKNRGGLIRSIVEAIHNRPSSLTIEDFNPLDQTVIKRLSSHEAQYNTEILSNSHRTGGRMVYSYGQNKYATVRMNELRRLNDSKHEGEPVKTSTLLTRLSQMPFSANSHWLQEMVEMEDGEFVKADNGELVVKSTDTFYANFHLFTTSLEPLKKAKAQSKDNRELHNLAEAEHELYKMGLLMSDKSDESGRSGRVIHVLYPTNSDKTTSIGLQVKALRVALNNEGNVHDLTIEQLYEILVAPEIARIQAFQKLKPDVNNSAYNQGANRFFLLPSINNIKGIFNADGTLNENIEGEEMKALILQEIRNNVHQLVNDKLAQWKNFGLVGGKLQLDERYVSKKLRVDEKHTERGAAADMVVQYLVANAEIFKMFIGDPAQFFKTAVHKQVRKRLLDEAENTLTGEAKQKRIDEIKLLSNQELETYFTPGERIGAIEDTFINIGKRLAADIAPGQDLADAFEDEFTISVLKDYNATAKNIKELEQLLGGLAKAYKGFESTDAQELTTWQEHLKVMWKLGKLTRDEYDTFTKKLRAKKDLTKKELTKVLQPMKPVYVNNIVDPSGFYERRVYVKSSSFPLLPQLIRGLELEKLEAKMQKEKVDRVAFATAVKVGAPSDKNMVDIWEADGRIKDDFSLESGKLRLSRSGFRIQQEVPYDATKSSINRVSQMMKNVMVNMMDVDGFKLKWYDGGKPLKGAELNRVFIDVWEKLFVLSKEELINELKNEQGEFDRNRLIKMLRSEAIERNYPITEVEMTKFEEFLEMLPYLPSADRFESLLNSIVTNRIIKQKMPGKSFVLGTEEGFKKRQDVDPEQYIKENKDGIAFTPAFEGELKDNQVLVPWKFTTPDGKPIDMADFVDEKGNIDMDKVDQDVLKLFGMRIPNQGPNSQRSLEIAGFLPKASGDLIVATRNLVVQMGSDFDVDKLYTHIYNVEVVEGGKLQKFIYTDGKENRYINKWLKDQRKSGEDVLKDIGEIKRRMNRLQYQNYLIDIMHAVHENPDPKVQKQIHTPLGFWKLKEISADIEAKRRARTGQGKTFVGISDSYQRMKFINATAGKSGVGVFARDSSFNATIQSVNTFEKVGDKTEVKMIPIQVIYEKHPYTTSFGNKFSMGVLNEPYALNGELKSDIISGYLSAAVDNEKEQILDKLNLNSVTYSVVTLLNQMGFAEEVPYFITQDIIFDYVDELSKLRSSINNEQKSDLEQKAARTVIEKYTTELAKRVEQRKKNELIIDESHDEEFYKSPSLSELKNLLENGDQVEEYYEMQLGILNKFLELDEVAGKLSKAMSAINADSKGIPIDMATLAQKARNSKRLSDWLVNGEQIIQDEKGNTNTVNGVSIKHGLWLAEDLWVKGMPNIPPIFPQVGRTIQGLLRNYKLISQQDFMSEAEEIRIVNDLWTNLKSYLFANSRLGLSRLEALEERRRLTEDITQVIEGPNNHKEYKRIKSSLASIVKEIKNNGTLRDNAFFNKLQPFPGKTGIPGYLKINAAVSEDYDPINTYASFIDLLTNERELGTFNGNKYTTVNLAQDLIAYTYYTGGVQQAVQFVRYIPPAYLKALGVFDYLTSLDVEELVKSSSGTYNHSGFMIQYIQHHPGSTPEVKWTEIQKKEGENFLTLNEIAPDSKILNMWRQVMVAGELKSVPVPFIHLANKDYGYGLFMYNKGRNVYERIDSLGSRFGMKEYDFQKGLSQSSYSKNTAYRTTSVQSDRPELGDAANTNKVYPITKLIKVGGRTTHEANLKNGAKSVKKGSALQQLLMELAKRTDQFPANFQVSYDASSDKVTAYVKTEENGRMTLSVNQTLSGMQDPEKAFKVYAHESVHILTGSKVRAYRAYLKAEGTKESRMKRFGLTQNEIEALSELQRVFLEAKQKLIAESPQTEQAIKTLSNRNKLREAFSQERISEQQLNEMLAEHPVSAKENDQFYGFVNLEEFIAEVFSNPVFREQLNEMKDESGKSWLKKLIEKISRLLEALGVKKGSYLETAITNSMALIDNTPNTAELEQDSQNEAGVPSTNYLGTTAEIPIQIYTDGSHIKGTKTIGYGAFTVWNGKEYRMSGRGDNENMLKWLDLGEGETISNPTMEMMAALKVLEVFKDKNEHIEIFSDYEGVQKWLDGTWQAKKPYIKKIVEQAKIYIASIEQKGGSVKFTWVKGHSGDFNNEQSDAAAKSQQEYNELVKLFPKVQDLRGLNLAPELENSNPRLALLSKLTQAGLIDQQGLVKDTSKALTQASEIVRAVNQDSISKVGVPIASLNWAGRKLEFNENVEKYKSFRDNASISIQIDKDLVEQFKNLYNLC